MRAHAAGGKQPRQRSGPATAVGGARASSVGPQPSCPTLGARGSRSSTRSRCSRRRRTRSASGRRPPSSRGSTTLAGSPARASSPRGPKPSCPTLRAAAPRSSWPGSPSVPGHASPSPATRRVLASLKRWQSLASLRRGRWAAPRSRRSGAGASIGKEGGRSNFPTGHASRGPATPVGIFPCFWATEMPEHACPGTVLQRQWTRLVACAVDWVVGGKGGKVESVLQANTPTGHEEGCGDRPTSQIPCPSTCFQLLPRRSA